MVCPQFDSLPNYALTDHAVCVASRLVIVAVLAPLCDSLPRPIATHLVQTLIVVQVEHECPSLAVGVAVVSLIVRHCHASSRVVVSTETISPLRKPIRATLPTYSSIP